MTTIYILKLCTHTKKAEISTQELLYKTSYSQTHKTSFFSCLMRTFINNYLNSIILLESRDIYISN